MKGVRRPSARGGQSADAGRARSDAGTEARPSVLHLCWTGAGTMIALEKKYPTKNLSDE